MINLKVLEAGANIELGAGTFGTVHLQKYAGTPVAVKRIRPQFIQALQKEVENLALLTHPNIISMIAFNNEFIVMAAADGNAGRINSMKELAIVGRDCMRALSYMQTHGNCMMHADLKPDNILVYKNNGIITRAVLGDVGLAGGCNMGQGFVGTPGYMPDDDIPISGFDDIFALAVSLLDAAFHETIVHTTFRQRDGMNSISEDNTQQYVQKMANENPKFAKIISFMLQARVTRASRELDITQFMSSLIKGFETLVDESSKTVSERIPSFVNSGFEGIVN